MRGTWRKYWRKERMRHSGGFQIHCRGWGYGLFIMKLPSQNSNDWYYLKSHRGREAQGGITQKIFLHLWSRARVGCGGHESVQSGLDCEEQSTRRVQRPHSDIHCPALPHFHGGHTPQWVSEAGTQRQAYSLEKQDSWDSSFWLPTNLVELNFLLNFCLKCFYPIASFLFSVLHLGLRFEFWAHDPLSLPKIPPHCLTACFSQGRDKHRHLLGENCPLFTERLLLLLHNKLTAQRPYLM